MKAQTKKDRLVGRKVHKHDERLYHRLVIAFGGYSMWGFKVGAKTHRMAGECMRCTDPTRYKLILRLATKGN